MLRATAELAEAAAADRVRFAEWLGARVPETWPPPLMAGHEPELTGLLSAAGAAHMLAHWYWVRDEPGWPRALIGAGGLSAADPQGAAEIGYAVLPEYQRQGFATEAVGLLVRWAFERWDKPAVFGHTFPDLHGSIRVLERCGFLFNGPGPEEGTVQYIRYREERRASSGFGPFE